MKTKTLNSKFVSFILLIILVVLILSSVITLLLSVNLISGSVQESLTQSMYIGQANVNAWFKEKEQMLNMIRDDIRMFDSQDKDSIEEYLNFYMENYPFLVDVYIGTPDNRMISGSHWVPDEGYDVREREWFTGAKKNNGLYYTPPYIDAYSGMMVVTISTPITDKNGADMGVIALDLKLDSLVEFVNNTKVANTSGTAFLLDSNKNIITHANEAFLPKIEGETEKYTSIMDIGISGIENIDFATAMIDKVRGWDGQQQFFATIGIESNGWTYGFEVPTSDFSAMYLGLILKWGIVILAMALLSLLLAKKLTKTLLTPVQSIISAAHTIALGDVDVHVDIKTGDELEMLAHELNSMVETTTKQIEAMRKMADGDFTVQIEPKSDKDILTDTINAVISRLRKLVEDINQLSSQVASSSSQISEGAMHLANGATSQAADVDDVSSLLTSILDNTKESAAYAQQSAGSIVEMRDMASSGTASMQHMVTSVNEINAASSDIEKIIKVIDDIAFQTNILALNAAVEAARAGEHGKGFAVVADEVRSLAAKSAEATQETAKLITNSSSKASDGVKIAGETQKVFEEIVARINSVDELISKIDLSSKDQVDHVEQINSSVKQISQVVQQTSATAEESAAASQEMSTQAQALKSLLQAFRTKE